MNKRIAIVVLFILFSTLVFGASKDVMNAMNAVKWVSVEKPQPLEMTGALVIGFFGSAFRYSNEDKKRNEAAELETDGSGGFVEIYVSENWGIGAHYLWVNTRYADENTSYEIDIKHKLFTIQWINIIGEERINRAGFFGGGGLSYYKYSESDQSASMESTKSAPGNSVILGWFIDGGGGGLGFRFSAYILGTEFDEFEVNNPGLSADGSGYGLTIGFRWGLD
jgi:hypothetical protein